MKYTYLYLLGLLILFVIPASDALGINWGVTQVNLAFGETRCVNYKISGSKIATLEYEGGIEKIVINVSPEKIDFSKGDSGEIKLCLEGKYGSFPFKPKTYSGEVFASEVASGGGGGGSGSGTAMVVAAPLVVTVGDMSIYTWVVRLSIISVIAIILIVAYILLKRHKKILREEEERIKQLESMVLNVCRRCNKRHPHTIKFCPECGAPLEKWYQGKRVG